MGAYTLGQGSLNFLTKGSIYCPSDFRGGAGLWPVEVKKSLGVDVEISLYTKRNQPHLR